MDIVIIGSGNAATVIGRKAVVSGHSVKQVVSRDPDHARILGELLKCPSGSISQIDRTALIYIVAVSDAALSGIGEWLHLDKAVVAHTAGSVSKAVLDRVSHNYGVLWPLQTLRKESETLPDFPLLVDANTPECLTILQDLASSLSDTVRVMGDEQRRKMHLAAVFSGNFTNHLFTMAYDYCEREGLDFRLMLPMFKETVNRLDRSAPAHMQTGPAIRHDTETLDRHMQMLDQYEEMREVYEMMSALLMRSKDLN